MDPDLSQKAQREFFEHQGEGPWTVIRDSVYESHKVNCGIYCALSVPDRRDRALSDPAWDLTETDGAPGFSQGRLDGATTTTYQPTGGMNDGVEPLVLVREYHGAAESTVELDQQFRLFHNLRYDPDSGAYFTLDFTPGVNIIVGDNDAGKSTLLEAINLARPARLRGNSISTETPGSG
jgi:hypothetical protein